MATRQQNLIEKLAAAVDKMPAELAPVAQRATVTWLVGFEDVRPGAAFTVLAGLARSAAEGADLTGDEWTRRYPKFRGALNMLREGAQPLVTREEVLAEVDGACSPSPTLGVAFDLGAVLE